MGDELAHQHRQPLRDRDQRDTLARVSGDEFVFLCEDLTSPSAVSALEQRLEDALADPFVLSVGSVVVTASVGIAYAGPGEAVSAHRFWTQTWRCTRPSVLGVAPIGSSICSPPGKFNDLHDLERDLREALARAELDLACQPIVRTADGWVSGAEALLR